MTEAKLGERTYNHVDGWIGIESVTGKGPSKRREIFVLRWCQPGSKTTQDSAISSFMAGRAKDHDRPMPGMVNIRQDPFERTPYSAANRLTPGCFGYGNDFFAREFWRFVLVGGLRW